jgi:hypothetical protein
MLDREAVGRFGTRGAPTAKLQALGVGTDYCHCCLERLPGIGDCYHIAADPTTRQRELLAVA